MTLFNQELRRHDWGRLRQSSTTCRQDLPEILWELATAGTERDARAAYFRLEGACFPQRLVTESCVGVVSCLLAVLAGDPPDFVRGWVLEALRGIICGEPIDSEIEVGNAVLMSDCVEAAGAGLWLLMRFFRESSGADLENLRLIVSVVDADRSNFGK